PIEQALTEHAALGVAVFFGSSVVAVLAPMLTNLPLMPLAVLAWGPWWTAGLLLAGWIVGSALAFVLGRRAQATILRHLPSVQRHAGIDRLIDPRHRMPSLIMLRMTFPVDVLSYALGLFSRRTTLAETTVSTALGAAPFAVLFSLFPTLSGPAQWAVFGGSVVVFVLYVGWVLHRPAQGTDSADA
ncbi:MAG: VTT domain-containing protein, partial [Rubrivivax sp.]|nr:VTT domain-containing protein [Rubrivivax sp.]